MVICYFVGKKIKKYLKTLKVFNFEKQEVSIYKGLHNQKNYNDLEIK